MSKIVARMEKMKSGNLQGIQRHNQREIENHSNPDIDISRSHLNYDLVNDEPVNYREKVKNIIDSQRISKRAVRKDAVLVDEWIITSDKEFFEDLFDFTRKEFFETTLNYFEERCGKQNIAYAMVHFDETTPHMHLGVVPMVEGKLSSKQMFDRKALKDIQDELPKHLKDNGFDIERGIKGSERKHLSVEEYKENRQELDRMRKELSSSEKDVKFYKETAQKLLRQNNQAKNELEDVKSKLELQKLTLERTDSEIRKTMNIKPNSSWMEDNIMPYLQEKKGIGGVRYTLTPENLEVVNKLITDLHRSTELSQIQKAEAEHENFKLNRILKNKTEEHREEIREIKEENYFFKNKNNELETEVKQVIEDFENLVTNTETYMEHELNVDNERLENYRGFLNASNSFNYKWSKLETFSDAAKQVGKKIFEKINQINPLPVAKKFLESATEKYRSFRR